MAAMSTFRCSTARWACCRWRRPGGSRLGKCPNAWVPSIPAASRRPRSSARTAKWVQITGSDQHWAPLCNLLGLEAWGKDPALARNADRLARREEIMAGLQQAIRRLDRDELCRRCDTAGVPAGPILQVDEVLANEHVAARGMVVDFEHPLVGRFRGLRVPLRFDGMDDPRVGRPPLLGEHTDEVLREKLGLDDAGIARLRGAGAV